MLKTIYKSDEEEARNKLEIPLDESLNKLTLKKYYKNIVKKQHPDKGGDKKNFQNINKAYKLLKEEVMKNEYVAQNHNELKEEYKKPAKKETNKKIDIGEFNNEFEQKRTVEKGYGDREWKPSVDIPTKVKEKSFNEEFMKIACAKEKVKNEDIDIYRPPDSLFELEDNTGIAVLGGVENPEYSSQDNDLPYADFWKAYGDYSGPRTSQFKSHIFLLLFSQGPYFWFAMSGCLD